MKKKVKIHYSSIFAIIFIIASLYLIHAILLFNKIETFARYVIVGVIGLIDLLILIKLFFGKKKKKRRIVFSTILILFTALFVFLGYNLNKIYSYFSGLNKKVVYSISLVSLKEKSQVDLSKLKDAKIGVKVDEEQDLSKDIINKYNLDKNNTLVNYEDYHRMILDLYDGEVDYIFLQTNFVDIYSTNEGFEDIGDKIVVVDTTQKEVTKEEVQLSGSSKDVSEPFTILLIGIDSTINGLQNADSFNGDSLIVVTFNPSTMSATMLSIPRDSYVPITCMGNVDNKITHSAASGTKCVINTIQNFLDIKIDYYMKINFTGVVDLVNAVGGIEVDVPYNICEQDSKRRFGDYTIYIRAGKNVKLDGESALAFARNRKSNSQYCSKTWTQGERSDFVRAANQQTVIQAILNKMKSFSSIDDLKNVLKIISKNFDTNMSESTMFSFYNIAKDVLVSSSSDNVISIQKLYLDGTGQMIYDERSRLVLWDYILNQKSVSAVKKAMKDNLSGAKKELIKTFSYKLGENYELSVIGKGYYGTEKYKLVANLVGMKLSAAQSWAKTNGLTLEVEYVEDKTSSNDTVISQSYPESKRIDLIKDRKMTVKVVKNESSTPTPSTKVNCLEDIGNQACLVQNFVGKSKSDYLSWAKGFSNVVDTSFVEEESDQTPGVIIKQSVEAGTTVKNILDNNTTITITIAKAKSNSGGNGGSSEDPPSGGDENQGGNQGESGGNQGESGGDNQGGSDTPSQGDDSGTGSGNGEGTGDNNG